MRKYSILIVMLVLLVSSQFACGQETLQILTWPHYYSPQLLEDFETRYGVTIELVEMDAPQKIKEEVIKNQQIDLIITDAPIVRELIVVDMVDPLDKELIPNLSNIDKLFLNLPHDPKNLYTVPYHYIPFGLLYNADKLDEEDVSLKSYFEPSENLKGRISIYPDPRLNIGFAMKYLGNSFNSTADRDLQAVKSLLENLNQNSIKKSKDMTRGTYQVVYEIDKGLADMGLWYYTHNDFSQIGAKSNIKVKIPCEGVRLGVDVFAIPSHTDQRELAHKFINYFYNPGNAAKSVEALTYPVAIMGVRERLEPTFAQKVFLSPQILQKSEFQIPFTNQEDRLYQQLWDRVFKNSE